MKQTKMEGGTERHLPKTDDRHRKNVEMKQKKYRLIEAFEQKHCVLRLQ